MCESRGENKALKKDFAELRQLYSDAQEDIQILREALAKQNNCNNKIKDGTEDPRQDLISQLEKSQEKVRDDEDDGGAGISAVVRVLSSHQCGLGLIPVGSHMC